MLQPTFSKHYCTDGRKGDINSLPFLKKKEKNFKAKFYPNTKLHFYEVKFSVRYLKMSEKTIYSLFCEKCLLHSAMMRS